MTTLVWWAVLGLTTCAGWALHSVLSHAQRRLRTRQRMAAGARRGPR